MKKKLGFIIAIVVALLVFVPIVFAKTKNKGENQANMKTADETRLETILSQENIPFTPTKNEATEIATFILQNEKAFLADLKFVLENDNDNLLILCDKNHYLESTFKPSDLIPLTDKTHYTFNRNDLSLRLPAEKSLVVMAEGAKQDGITLLVSSTFRSYEYQKSLFQRWVDIDGLEEAERESAHAGASQHQLGTAIDFGSIEDSFAETAMGKWLYDNGAKYGWSLSFPKEYEIVTGYRWECWHYRYIGQAACQFQAKWFKNVQQYMLEFINAWENSEN